MAFKMKGSPIKLGKIQGTSGHASALKQQADLASLDQDYVDNLLKRSDGDMSYDELNKAHKKEQMKEIREEIAGLKVGKGLNKAMREQKKIQKEGIHGTKGHKIYDKGHYNRMLEGPYNIAGEVPKWYSPGWKKREYIKKMKMAQLQDLGRTAMTREQMDEFDDSGIDPTTMGNE
tara:strand:- start:557 stop:1081 length:525 start_codon:yes stop_codon:yes gene_type:complete